MTTQTTKKTANTIATDTMFVRRMIPLRYRESDPKIQQLTNMRLIPLRYRVGK